MRVKAVYHKKAVACGGCGKELPPGRSYYLPESRKRAASFLCGRCGMAELNRAGRLHDDGDLVVGDSADTTPE